MRLARAAHRTLFCPAMINHAYFCDQAALQVGVLITIRFRGLKALKRERLCIGHLCDGLQETDRQSPAVSSLVMGSNMELE